jgi:hypothetical protein
MKKMKEGQQGSVENIKVGAKVHPHGQPEKIMTVISPDGGFGGKVSVKDEKGNKASFDAEDLELVGVMKEVDAVGDTNKMKRMEGNVPTSTSTTSVQDMNMGNDGKPAIPGLKEKMSSKEKMAKGLYNEVDAEMDTDKMKKMKEATDFSNHYDYTYRLVDGNCIRINPETQERAKVHHTYCNHLKKEMQTNVAEEGQVREFAEEGTQLITALATLLGIGVPLATSIYKDLKNAKTPEAKKQVMQSLGTSVKGAAGAHLQKPQTTPSLNELRKQVKK